MALLSSSTAICNGGLRIVGGTWKIGWENSQWYYVQVQMYQWFYFKVHVLARTVSLKITHTRINETFPRISTGCKNILKLKPGNACQPICH